MCAYDPYRGWFSAFEPVLNGLGASYYEAGGMTALHTDSCSPVATNPTWSRLHEDDCSALEADGGALWHILLEELKPQVVALSVARAHLGWIAFSPMTDWEVSTPSGERRTAAFVPGHTSSARGGTAWAAGGRCSSSARRRRSPSAYSPMAGNGRRESRSSQHIGKIRRGAPSRGLVALETGLLPFAFDEILEQRCNARRRGCVVPLVRGRSREAFPQDLFDALRRDRTEQHRPPVSKVAGLVFASAHDRALGGVPNDGARCRGRQGFA